MSETPVTFTRSNLVAAFTEWERQYRENPDQFWSDVRRFTKETPATYGDAAADCLLTMLNKVKE